MSWPGWQTTPTMQGVLPTQAMAPPVQAAMMATPVNAAPAVMPPNMQYSPDQWAQMQQQNWQQWAQWQQQYQQWHQQYGAEYQKSVTAMAAATVPQLPVMPVSSAPPPPLPTEKPPLPPEEPPVELKQTPNYTTPSYTTAPPKPASGYSNQPQFNRLPPTNTFNTQSVTSQPPPTHQQWGGNKRPLGGNDQYESNNKRQMLDNQWGANQSNKGSNQWQHPPPAVAPAQPPPNTATKNVNLEELSEAEKKFDKEFAAWEAQFNRWKDQNVSHPDKTQYKQYEKKWESWRNSLLERREQMRKKRLALQATKVPQTSAPPPMMHVSEPPPSQPSALPSLMSTLIAPPPSFAKDQGPVDIFSKPPPTQNNEPLSFNINKTFPGEDIPEHNEPETGEGFLGSGQDNAGGIPGLDLVDKENSNSNDREVVEKEREEQLETNKGPDLEAISKGINSILGDQKLLSMLSMVSQNQNIGSALNAPINTIPKLMGSEFDQQNRVPEKTQYGGYHNSEQSNHSYEDQQQIHQYNQRESVNNFDDQTRMSFPNGPNDQDTMGPNFGNRNQTRFGGNNNMMNKGGNDNIGRFGGPQGFNEENFGSGTNNRGSFDNYGRNNSFNDDEFGNNQGQFERFNDRGGFNDKGGGFNNRSGGFSDRPGGFSDRPGGFSDRPGGFSDRPGGFNDRPGGFSDRPGGFNDKPGGFNEKEAGGFNDRGGGFNDRGGFNGRGKGFDNRGGFNDNSNQFRGNNFNNQGGNFNSRNDNFGKTDYRRNSNDHFRDNDNYNDNNYDNDYNDSYDKNDYNNDNQGGYDQGYNDDYQDENWNEEEDFNKYHEMFNESEDQDVQPPPPNIINEPEPPSMEEEKPMFVPEMVVDYEHKSLKLPEPEVIITPVYTFDYRHKQINRLPFPQRPKWLLDSIKNIREFEPIPRVVYERPLSFERPQHFDQWQQEPKKEERRFQDRNASIYRDQEPVKPLKIDFANTRNYDRFNSSMDDNRRDFDFNRRETSYSQRDRNSDDKHRRGDKNFRTDNFREDNFRDDRHSHTRNRNDSFMNRRNDFEELSDDDLSDNEGNQKDIRGSPDLLQGANPSNPNLRGPPVSQVTMMEDLINPPGRYNRPPRIVIILRGPPGSGKTYLAKLIKDKEVESGGSAPRILSLDDYFMVEQEKEVMEDGKLVKIKDMVYEFEAEMEESYRQSFMKSFKKTVTDGYFPFIIVDNVNEKVKHFGEMWSFAKQNGFQVYICQMDLDPDLCSRRNIHNRSKYDIEECIASWEPTPSHHPVLDATGFLQDIEVITEVEMEDDLAASASHDVNDDVDDGQDVEVSSKWDSFDCSRNNLARLDGVSKPLRRTMEEFLQLDDSWEEPSQPTKPGQKRVRWADLEEQKQQTKMRAIGFVVGQTNWNRMLDPTNGGSALTQTKYIERVNKRPNRF